MNQKLWWYTVRASGLVAWALVAASVLWGLLLSSRLVRRPRPSWVLDLHRFLGGLACAFLAMHLVGVLADSYVGFGAIDLVVPMAARWRPRALAWGIVALDLVVAVELTSVMMRHLPRGLWHTVHLTSLVAFGAITVHAFLAGADSANPLVVAFASVSTGLVLVLGALRIRTSAPPTVGATALTARPRIRSQ